MENKLEIGVICFACANEHIVLLQAWDLYYHVFRRIDKQLPSLTTLDLQARIGYIRFHWWFDSFIYFMWCMSLVSLHYKMQSVSPELLNCRNLELAVPGTYRAGKWNPYVSILVHTSAVLIFMHWIVIFFHCIETCFLWASGSPVVTISTFAHQLIVITSKQRPRKLTIHGSDGEDYAFLLKGHEDLRQDERVMQVWHFSNQIMK